MPTATGGANQDPRHAGKLALRAHIRARRAERDAQAVAVGAALDRAPAAGGTVAGFLSRPGEPDVAGLRAALRARGVAVLLPWLRADLDLDWVPDDGTAAGPSLHPAGRRLGRDAVLAATLLLVPALAVDATGTRLGHGGGSYDRVLRRVRRHGPPGAVAVACVAAEEVLPHGSLPREPHDEPVDAVLTPLGWRWVGTHAA